MPTESLVVIVGVLAAFIGFAVILAFADAYTSKRT